MEELAPKRVRLVPNGTNPGLFQIRFQYILAHCWYFWYWYLIWKSCAKSTEIWSEKVPDLSHLGAIWPAFGQAWHVCRPHVKHTRQSRVRYRGCHKEDILSPAPLSANGILIGPSRTHKRAVLRVGGVILILIDICSCLVKMYWNWNNKELTLRDTNLGFKYFTFFFYQPKFRDGTPLLK